MKYKTGEIADLFGMTKSGVIFLEEKGIIKAERCENGYRAYPVEEVTKLGQIRSLQRMGYGLSDAVELLRNHNQESLVQSVDQKIAEVEESLRLLKYYKESLSMDCVDLSLPLSTQKDVRIEPYHMYWTPLWEELPEYDTFNKQILLEMAAIDVSWLKAMPYMTYCAKTVITEQGIQMYKGNSISAKQAAQYQVMITPLAEVIDEKKCLVFHTVSTDSDEVMVRAVRDYLAEKGYQMKGNIIYSRILGLYLPEDHSQIYICKQIVPLCD